MCGISGFFDLRCGKSSSELRSMAIRMSDTLRHRGPDDAGVWTDADAGIALSMRRLAVLDLSETGHQPMESPSGRYVLVFNGEIYNFEEIKDQLGMGDGSYYFRGTSDTEVMLAAFEKWGVEHSVAYFNGMFAFSVWDRYERVLTLARDRFGEKPLYYCRVGSSFLFGSELRALRAHPAFSAEVDLSAVAQFLRHSCVPAPYSIYKNARKLPAATLLRISAKDFESSPRPYWSLREVVEEAISNPLQSSESEAIEQLDWILRDAVRIRMRSDVYMGAMLSGGIDSSTVVSLMQAQSSSPVRTFSVGSYDKEFDEAQEASNVARHLNTEHTELYVTPEEALAVVPSLPQIYDEPFSDPSQIPTILVSQLARKHVTVCLTGDGGDEIFGGYNRHTWGDTVGNALHSLPRSLRKIGAAGMKSLPPDRWDSLFRTCQPAIPARWRLRMPGYKLHKVAAILESRDNAALYDRLSSHWLDSQEILQAFFEPRAPSFVDRPRRLRGTAEEMMYLDTIGYLPDDIMVKLDRATMAVGLEGRVPLLDHRVAEFAWRLPLNMRIRRRQGKWILRQVLYRHVPRNIVDRPKSGFGIPLAAWLRGPLRDWAESLLHENRLRQEGYFQPEPIAKIWRAHLSGQTNWEYCLWDILMFQAWLDENRRDLGEASSTLNGPTEMADGAYVHGANQGPACRDRFN
jgi:asparagine synthase (glutamine-hydrolysing)